LLSGQSKNGRSGSLNISSPSAPISGFISMQTGTSTSGNSGSLSFASGDAVNGASGDVTFSVGKISLTACTTKGLRFFFYRKFWGWKSWKFTSFLWKYFWDKC
jgi:hypothetical protein